MHHSTRLFTITGLMGGLLLTGAACQGQVNALQVGDSVPDFKCLDDQGQIWDSRDHVGKKVIVVYFYSSDFAFCCTRQAVCYRDCRRELAAHGVEVVGVSGDVVAAHRMFKETHRLNCALLADWEGNVARKFGVPLRAGGKAMVKDADGKAVVDAEGAAIKVRRDFTAERRTTFVIGKDGRIIYQDVAVSPVKDCQEVLEFLCEYSSSTPPIDP